MNIDDILASIDDYSLGGEKFLGEIIKVGSIQSADKDTVVWVAESRPDKYSLISETNAKLIVCDPSIELSRPECEGKCFILVNDPKLIYLRIVKKLFSASPKWGVHATAVIHPDAKIHKNTYIGPFSYVGNATIGEGTILHGHCHVYDNSIIGKNVILHAQTVVGSDGFGFLWNDENKLEKFLHIGCAVIEDDVEMYPFSNIDRGTLSETIIKQGSKIDHFSHIGHNSSVGENTIITAGVVLCGGSQVGNNAWVGVNSIVKEKVKLGDECLVGLGSIVTKDVPDGETWMGAPARKIKEFIMLQGIFKKMIKGNRHD